MFDNSDYAAEKDNYLVRKFLHNILPTITIENNCMKSSINPSRYRLVDIKPMI